MQLSIIVEVSATLKIANEDPTRGVAVTVKFEMLKPLAMIMGPIAILLLIGGIINVVYTIQFVEDMKKKNCNCSKSVFREMMFILAILQAISWIFLIILLIIAIIYRKNIPMKQIVKKFKARQIVKIQNYKK